MGKPIERKKPDSISCHGRERDCGSAAYRRIDLRRDNKAAIFSQGCRRIKWLHARGAQYQDSPGVRPKVRVTKQLMTPPT